MPFDLSDLFKENFSKLDLTNSILVKIAIFLTQTNKFSEFDKNDKRIIKDENNKKLVNDLMNVLLDESVENNKNLYEKINAILQNISEDNQLKKEISQLFESKKDEISKTENRWDELKKIIRNETKDDKKFKRKTGFFQIYKQEDGLRASGINIKLINSPITKEKEKKYQNNLENSKYFNLWLRKTGDFQQVYATKLADLFYAEGKKEDLFKIRPDYKIIHSSDNRKNEYIFTKYVKKVGSYKDLRQKIQDIFDNKTNTQDQNKEYYYEILDSIEPKSVLKTLLINLFLSTGDKNIGNLLTKTDSDGKISLIPIDFGVLNLLYKEFEEYKRNPEYKQELLDALKKQNFKKAKEALIKNETIDQGGYFSNIYNKFDQNFQSNINLEHQLSRISDEEFKEILKNMLSNESEINQIFDELREEYKKTLKEKHTKHIKQYGNTNSQFKTNDLEIIQIFEYEMNSFLEIKDYLDELRGVVKNFDIEENKVEEDKVQVDKKESLIAQQPNPNPDKKKDENLTDEDINKPITSHQKLQLELIEKMKQKRIKGQ